MPVRFDRAHDILLLREVLAVNPYERPDAKAAWQSIAETLNSSDKGFSVDFRSCRDHTALMLSKFKKKDIVSRKK
jgi:hypothetical protein